jgi:hypothetical protein|tara:strand:- start:1356 stop:2024 length:669 start_codon:yes stop_codon:yes gene_type:complete
MSDKYKIPEGYEWEVHNLHAYADKKKAFERGEITLVQLREFEHQYMESEEQRAMRWRRDHVMRELDIENAKNFRSFKENSKAFAKKMADMGRGISRWWYTKPKKAVPGKGKLIQNKITGAWQQEYKPNKSMNMRAWLDAANQGKVMSHMNPQGKSLDREPTEQEKGISKEAKKERGKKVWQWVLGETNNFGRGWVDPKWGKLNKGEPGQGGRMPKVGKYTVK